LAATALPASSQALERLTVQSFALATDTARPRVDVPFHLIVTLRVRERIDRVANLELPMLADLELLGDERQTVSSPRGSQYRETITVVSHSTGAIAVAPATLQAIDARDGKPKQWYTNGLTLQIVGGAGPGVRPQVLLGPALFTLRVLLWIAGLGCIAIVLALLFRRRRASIAVVSAPAPAAPLPVLRSPREQLADALLVLRTERTRSAAVRVRRAVWGILGANDGETLGDVLRRRESADATMRQLLVALERSAFTYDHDLRAAIEDACSALERQIDSPA
jgi:hypothetical protein